MEEVPRHSPLLGMSMIVIILANSCFRAHMVGIILKKEIIDKL